MMQIPVNMTTKDGDFRMGLMIATHAGDFYGSGKWWVQAVVIWKDGSITKEPLNNLSIEQDWLEADPQTRTEYEFIP